MRFGGLGFLLGVLWSAYLPQYGCVGLLFLLLLGIWPGWQRHFFILMLAGLVWMWLYLHWFSPQPIPEAIDGKTVTVIGEVISIPRTGRRSTRFDFQITNFQDMQIGWRGRVRLSWYHPLHELIPGQVWALRIKLKPAHGFANPGGFDYERWLFSRGIAATGYVRNVDQARLLTSEFSLHSFRQSLGEGIIDLLPEQDFAGVLIALVNGDRQHIDQNHWRDMSRTGTTHLMAISGLHIGLVYGVFFWFARLAWKSFARLCLLRPAEDIALMVGLFAAIIYAGLAGFSIPTQRAVIMLFVVTMAMLSRRLSAPLDVLQVAMVLVLILDPLSILSAGFWLSFMAVALIFLMLSGGAQPVPGSQNPLRNIIRMQWFLAVGMLPLSALLFNQVSIVAPAVNMIAVPVVGLIVVPLSLAGAMSSLVSSSVGTILLHSADVLVGWLWLVIDTASNSTHAVIHPSGLPWWLYVCVSVGAALLLFYSRLVYRLAGFLLILPVLVTPSNALKHSEYQVDILDVGQGLAVVVKTSNHTLLYDTGFANDDGFDIGQRVIAPYLRHEGIHHLHRVVLSHDDQDHAGGYAFLRTEFEIGHLSVMPGSRYEADSKLVSTCQAGDFWQWDGITFRFLHPGMVTSLKENDRSCVLHISGPGGSALLTGDIERRAETELVNRYAGKLAADVLLAPHHGSATSSSAEFIAQVKPREVIYSAGFRNRFGFPRAEVISRYQDHGAEQYSTAKTGMVRFHFPAQHGNYRRMLYRQEHHNFWHQPAEH